MRFSLCLPPPHPPKHTNHLRIPVVPLFVPLVPLKHPTDCPPHPFPTTVNYLRYFRFNGRTLSTTFSLPGLTSQNYDLEMGVPGNDTAVIGSTLTLY